MELATDKGVRGGVRGGPAIGYWRTPVAGWGPSAYHGGWGTTSGVVEGDKSIVLVATS